MRYGAPDDRQARKRAQARRAIDAVTGGKCERMFACARRVLDEAESKNSPACELSFFVLQLAEEDECPSTS